MEEQAPLPLPQGFMNTGLNVGYELNNKHLGDTIKLDVRFLKLRYFGFRGKAQFVYLARPAGPGPRFI